MQALGGFYQKRFEQFSAKAQSLRGRFDRFSWVRLFIFVAGLAGIILLSNFHWALAIGFALVFIVLFLRFMRWHEQIMEAAKHAERLSNINLEEKNALEHRFDSFPNGAAYLNPEHPYALDLDVFGPYSFFQYCCRATTVIGQERLADYLSSPAETSVIIARQVAVQELSPLTDWRQHFRAFGQGLQDDPRHLQLLEEWRNDPDWMLNNRWLLAALVLAPLWFFCCLLLWFFFVPWSVFLALLLPTFWVLKQTKEQVDRTHLRTTYAGELLNTYARLLQHIEQQDFQAPLLVSLKGNLGKGNLSASKHIRQLSYLIRQLNVRYNFFAIFLNIIGLWDLYWVWRLEKWRNELREKLPAWFESLQEFEALSSLANLHFNNPAWVFPDVVAEENLESVGLAHPLIPASKRIGNDLAMPVRSHIKLLTGSNMAGKSTFLRTVGLNAVLAFAGAPVCAKRLRLPRLHVYSSMRTQDALHDSTSSFYAELKRLKVIIEAVAAAQCKTLLPVFFLLDEILKGTNSVDRHTGSAALIQQLIRQNGGGIIATHDLELGRLEAGSNGTVENCCMEVEIRGGALFFDYKIKKGVSRSFNATLLMRQMGIEV